MRCAVDVEFYAGYTANERPLRFHIDGTTLQVVHTVETARSPNSTRFRVLAHDGSIWRLENSPADPECWTAEPEP